MPTNEEIGRLAGTVEGLAGRLTAMEHQIGAAHKRIDGIYRLGVGAMLTGIVGFVFTIAAVLMTRPH